MIPNHQPYQLDRILERIDAILSKDSTVQIMSSSVTLDSLDYCHTYSTSVICMSISLPYPALTVDSNYKQYQLYKALSSEMSSILNENRYVRDIDFSNSNKIIALLQLPEEQYDSVIDLAARVSSLARIVDRRARSLDFLPFNVVIGIDAGLSYVTRQNIEISHQSELLWIGKPLVEAVRLSSLLQIGDVPIIISDRVFSNLSAKYKGFFTQDNLKDIFVSSLRNNAMATWMESNLQQR